jgi:predicted DNA-binding protein with PD1-like motif
MRWQLLHQDGQKTYVIVFAVGDEVMSTLTDFVREQGVGAASFTAIGAFSEARLGYFDWEGKEFQEIPVPEQVEVLTLAGDVALEEDEPKVHAHVFVGRRDGSTRGGHLLEARVRPTLELVLVQSPVHLRKRHDPETGLALIAPRDSDA